MLDKGAFGDVLKCLDCATNQTVALKIAKNKEFDNKNAQVEIKILDSLMRPDMEDNEGYESLVRMLNEFSFR